MVGKTCRVLHEVLAEAGISYELVVVDDGSKDKTWEEITKAGEKDGNVLGVHFSRNFGKKQQYMQEWPRLQEMWWQLWIVICSTRRKL